jgi:aspartate 1-decarboxylase
MDNQLIDIRNIQEAKEIKYTNKSNVHSLDTNSIFSKKGKSYFDYLLTPFSYLHS